jgi:hypothetical protein
MVASAFAEQLLLLHVVSPCSSPETETDQTSHSILQTKDLHGNSCFTNKARLRISECVELMRLRYLLLHGPAMVMSYCCSVGHVSISIRCGHAEAALL